MKSSLLTVIIRMDGEDVPMCITERVWAVARVILWSMLKALLQAC